jgi:hypothetical protein
VAQDNTGIPANYSDNLAVSYYSKVHRRHKISIDLDFFLGRLNQFMLSYDALLRSSIQHDRSVEVLNPLLRIEQISGSYVARNRLPPLTNARYLAAP